MTNTKRKRDKMSDQTEHAPDLIMVGDFQYMRVAKLDMQADIDAATDGKMKPCPWCGRLPTVTPFAEPHATLTVMVGCPSYTGCAANPHMAATSIEEAISKWNDRKCDQ